ncbi:hypothetical protein SKAU_G00102200 [Synaphobranchus kaupii]|uniref:Uncharacterized protein n=1 Tax=Synaphobranchus kaupii TaxID=118154 RepID=A0A9Q1FZE6_SYNKA|nr:hypothetical protein SKAU_G00102200 [Synaphobranchus kaupii]
MMEKQPSAPRRRGWSLTSLRIKSRPSEEEDEGFSSSCRGAKRFFSVRSDPRKSDQEKPEVMGPGAAGGEGKVTRPFPLRSIEKEKGNLKEPPPSQASNGQIVTP